MDRGKTPLLDRIEKEYGDIDSFVSHTKKWLEKLPRKYLKKNTDIQKINKRQSVHWEDPMTLAILERKVTSLDQVEWVYSVVNRIDKMMRHIRGSSIENHDHYTEDMVLSEKMQEEFEREKKRALDFMDDVRDYALQNLKVTEKQLEALNNTYKEFEQLI